MAKPILAFLVCCVLFVAILLTQHDEGEVTANSVSKGKDGYYGCPKDGEMAEHCSNIDWCEENYDHADWVAEIFNSFSSGIYVIMATFGTLGYFWQPIDRWAVGLGEQTCIVPRRMCP
jgi:hypothetical protein